MTEKEKFQLFLREVRQFKTSDVYCHLALVPHHYKDTCSNHLLISNLTITMFDGVDTPEGDLGCVCFYYGGVIRNKHCRHTRKSEALKRTILPKTAEEAIEEFDKWEKQTAKTIKNWKVIL